MDVSGARLPDFAKNHAACKIEGFVKTGPVLVFRQFLSAGYCRTSLQARIDFDTQPIGMSPAKAILFSLALIVVSTVATRISGYPVNLAMILISSMWAGMESSQIKLKNYQSRISNGPVMIFFACVLLWFIAFPWFLIMRHKIINGTAVLKPGHDADAIEK